MASRIPSRSRSSKQDVPPSSAPAGSTRLALSTPPELLSWLVDELGYVPAPSGSAARLPLAGTHWTLATEGKELKLSDLTRACRGSVHVLLHHLSIHILGRHSVSHVRSELHKLQTPSSAAHLSRPTLQTLFPSTSSHHAHSSSVAALTKLDSRLASLQAKLDASLVDARADERTDDETVSLKMRRDLVDAAGTRWRESVTRLEGLGQMVEREAGGEQDRSSLVDTEQKSELVQLLASISSYVANPSSYTKPVRMAERLLQISPGVLLDTLRVELDQAMSSPSLSIEETAFSDSQNAKDALMELHLLHLALSDRRRAAPKPSKRVHLETQLYQKLKKEYGDDKVGMEKAKSEILARIDTRTDRRMREDLVKQISPFGQDLLSRRTASRDKLAALEAERVSLQQETSALRATYDSLVASSQVLATESRAISSERLPSDLTAVEASLASLEGGLERELGAIGAEPWREKVQHSLKTRDGRPGGSLGGLLGKGPVGTTFDALHSTLLASIQARDALADTSAKMFVERSQPDDHTALLESHAQATSSFIASATPLLSATTTTARGDLARAAVELDKAKDEREMLSSGALLLRHTSDRARTRS